MSSSGLWWANDDDDESLPNCSMIEAANVSYFNWILFDYTFSSRIVVQRPNKLIKLTKLIRRTSSPY
jgi:hypothetical protein